MQKPISEEEAQKTIQAAVNHRRPDGSINWVQVGEELGISRNTVVNRVAVLAREGRLGFDPVLPGYIIKRTTTVRDKDGATVRTFVTQERDKGEKFKLPPTHVAKELSTYVDGDRRIIGQWIKSKEASPDPLAVAEALRASFEDWRPSYASPSPASPARTDRLAFFPISDLHVGMFSWGKETGQNWDLKIAQRTILETYSELVSQTPATDEAIVLFGGDQLHADNYDSRTEMSGHVLDSDGRYPKTLDVLGEIATEIVYMVRAQHRKVKVRVLKGNHDRHSSIALSWFLYAWFRDDDAVEIDRSPSDFWFHQFGNVMLCAVHGDKIKAQELPGKVAATQPKMWGNTTFRYAAYFHEHHDELRLKDAQGLVVEKHAIIAPSDAYHASGPHHAFRNAKSIVYDRIGGEKGRSTVNVIAEQEEAA